MTLTSISDLEILCCLRQDRCADIRCICLFSNVGCWQGFESVSRDRKE